MSIFLLIGLQSTLRPPNRNKVLSDTAVSVCHDLPTGLVDNGTLENIFCTMHSMSNHAKKKAYLSMSIIMRMSFLHCLF